MHCTAVVGISEKSHLHPTLLSFRTNPFTIFALVHDMRGEVSIEIQAHGELLRQSFQHLCHPGVMMH